MGVRLSNSCDEIKAIDGYLSDQKKKNAALALQATKEAKLLPKNGILFEDYPAQESVLESKPLVKKQKPFAENGLSGELSEAGNSGEWRDPHGELSPSNPVSDPILAARSRLKGLSTSLDRDTGHVLYLDGHRCVMSENVKSKKLFVSDDPSDEDILIMLVAAQEKYGEKFKLFGTNDFIERCTAIALVHNIKMQEFSANEKQRMRQ